jgi:hypothetical protein
MKYKNIIITFTTVMIPSLCIAGGGVSDENLEAVEFLQGGGIVEEWFMTFVDAIVDFGDTYYEKYVNFAQFIGGTLGLIYFGNKAWGMLAGDRQWDVLPLLRPLVFSLIIANWSFLVLGINSIFQTIEDISKEEVKVTQSELLAIRVDRFELQNKMIDAILEKRTEAKLAEKEQERENSGSGAWAMVPDLGLMDAVDEMSVWISTMYMKLQFNLQLFFSNLLENIGLLLMRLVIYGILYIQKIFILFLIILGPITFGFSILPAFNNAWKTWLSRFIGVQFWGIIAYTILQLGIVVQKFAMEAEIDRYKQIINENTGEIISMELLTTFGNSGVMSFGMVVLAYLLTAVGLLMTPTLSSFILGAGSLGGTTSKGTQLAKGITKVASGGLI